VTGRLSLTSQMLSDSEPGRSSSALAGTTGKQPASRLKPLARRSRPCQYWPVTRADPGQDPAGRRSRGDAPRASDSESHCPWRSGLTGEASSLVPATARGNSASRRRQHRSTSPQEARELHERHTLLLFLELCCDLGDYCTSVHSKTVCHAAAHRSHRLRATLPTL
jgi:hypothetical protein